MAVTRTGTVGADPNSVQFSDIGFGIQNLRSFGDNPTTCGVN
jgi:Fe-S-cluster formation regulator IscX/YfhJ